MKPSGNMTSSSKSKSSTLSAPQDLPDPPTMDDFKSDIQNVKSYDPLFQLFPFDAEKVASEVENFPDLLNFDQDLDVSTDVKNSTSQDPTSLDLFWKYFRSRRDLEFATHNLNDKQDNIDKAKFQLEEKLAKIKDELEKLRDFTSK